MEKNEIPKGTEENLYPGEQISYSLKRKLKELFDAGVINEQEYEEKRKKLLEQL